MAKEALEVAMDFYFEDRRPVPMPSNPKRGQAVVELPASVSAKVLLLNEMLRQNVRPIDLARRMGTTKQEVNRLTDLRHATKIDRVDDGAAGAGEAVDFGCGGNGGWIGRGLVFSRLNSTLRHSCRKRRGKNRARRYSP